MRPTRARPPWSAHFPDVGQVVGEDPASFGQNEIRLVVARQRRDEIKVRGYAADRDGPTEVAPYPLLEQWPAAFQGVAEERLALRETECHDVPIDADRTTGGDQRLDRRVLADVGDDVRPMGPELVEALG